MKVLSLIIFFAFLATQQVVCWTTLGPGLAGIWLPSAVTLLLAELGSTLSSAGLRPDRIDETRKYVSWALGGFAFLIPDLLFMERMLAILGGTVLFRLSGGLMWRFVVPIALAAAAFAAFGFLQPWIPSSHNTNLDWGFLPAGGLLLAHAVWLFRVTRRGRAPSGPDKGVPTPMIPTPHSHDRADRG